MQGDLWLFGLFPTLDATLVHLADDGRHLGWVYEFYGGDRESYACGDTAVGLYFLKHRLCQRVFKIAGGEVDVGIGVCDACPFAVADVGLCSTGETLEVETQLVAHLCLCEIIGVEGEPTLVACPTDGLATRPNRCDRIARLGIACLYFLDEVDAAKGVVASANDESGSL